MQRYIYTACCKQCAKIYVLVPISWPRRTFLENRLVLLFVEINYSDITTIWLYVEIDYLDFTIWPLQLENWSPLQIQSDCTHSFPNVRKIISLEIGKSCEILRLTFWRMDNVSPVPFTEQNWFIFHKMIHGAVP